MQSRIVFSDDNIRFQAIYDEPEAWKELAHQNPTLLVSDIEKWHPEAMRLMTGLPFIKSWRFDDLMMSYAPKNASVGAHTDHYDVFLVQVQGTRQWSYDEQPLADQQLVEDSELAVIKDYQPKITVELKPGDVLYLPPEIPHHGISTSDDCVTCSIGLRAPSNAELITAVTELATADMLAKNRFKDNVHSNNQQSSIGQHEVNHLRNQLKSISQADDQTLAAYFGQVITGYRLWDEFDDIGGPKNENFTQSLWQKNPFAVLAYHASTPTCATLFVNGEVLITDLFTATNVCDHATFSYQDNDTFQQLIEMNVIIPLTD